MNQGEIILNEILNEHIAPISLCHIEILPSTTPVDHPQAVQDVVESARKDSTPYFLTINVTFLKKRRAIEITKTAS